MLRTSVGWRSRPLSGQPLASATGPGRPGSGRRRRAATANRSSWAAMARLAMATWRASSARPSWWRTWARSAMRLERMPDSPWRSSTRMPWRSCCSAPAGSPDRARAMAANSRARAATRFSPMSPARARACPTLALAASGWASMAWSPASDWRAISSERRLPLAWASSSWQRRIPSGAGVGPQKAPGQFPRAQDSDGSSLARRAWVTACRRPPGPASGSAGTRARPAGPRLARPRWSSN